METLENQEVYESTPSVEQEVPPVENGNEKTYTKADVTNIMAQRVGKTYNAFYDEFGLEGENRNKEFLISFLREKVDYAQKAKEEGEQLRGEMETLKGDLFNAKKELAFLRNSVEPSKYDDILTYFKGKGKVFNEEDLIAELETHPEWKKAVEQATTVASLGAVKPELRIETNEDRKRRVFG